MTTARFRVWDKEQKVWISDYLGFYITPEGKFFHEFYEGEDEVLREVHHTLEEVMFSTNLKDKNGVEIFEGDIVKRTYLFTGGYGETHTGEIMFDKEYARFIISKPLEFIEPKTEDLRTVLSDRSTYEIIGNIHENPELIKEAQ